MCTIHEVGRIIGTFLDIIDDHPSQRYAGMN